jgi:hypothetical protein
MELHSKSSVRDRWGHASWGSIRLTCKWTGRATLVMLKDTLNLMCVPAARSSSASSGEACRCCLMAGRHSGEHVYATSHCRTSGNASSMQHASVHLPHLDAGCTTHLQLDQPAQSAATTQNARAHTCMGEQGGQA